MSGQPTMEGTDGHGSATVLVTVLVLVVATGCVGVAPVGDRQGSTADDDRPAGPWDGRLTVAPGPETPDRTVTALRAAAAYWRANASRYAGRDVDVVVLDGTRRDDADAVIRTTERVPDCGGVDEAAGCAPLVTGAGDVPALPVSVWVRGDLDRASTRRVLTHELGHLLGIGHRSDPDVMRRAVPLSVRRRPDATAGVAPWPDRTLSVHVDAAGAADTAAVRTQVRVALSYLEDDPPGVTTDWQFRLVDDPAGADVRVRVGVGIGPGTITDAGPNGNATGATSRDGMGADRSAGCGPAAGSCGRVVGPDPDGDGDAESYRRLTVSVGDVDVTAVGWHVGYWLSGTLTDGPRPPPFRDADYADRRGRWWASESSTRTRTAGSVDGGSATAVPVVGRVRRTAPPLDTVEVANG
jgi:hypothetical protein